MNSDSVFGGKFGNATRILRPSRKLDHRHEVLLRIVGQRLVGGRRDGNLGDRRNQQGVAVRVGADDGQGSKGAAGAGAVLDHHRLVEELGHALAEQPGNEIGATAGRIGDDELDRLGRPVLRLGRAGRTGKHGCRQCRPQPDPTTAPVGTDRSSAEMLHLPNDEAGHGHCEPFHHRFFRIGTLRFGPTAVNLRLVAGAFAALNGALSDICRSGTPTNPLAGRGRRALAAPLSLAADRRSVRSVLANCNPICCVGIAARVILKVALLETFP